jgi:hypothetical protein
MKRLVIISSILSVSLAFTGCVSPRLQNFPKTTIHGDEAIGDEDDEASGPGVRISEWHDPNSLFDWPVNEARMTRGFFLKPQKKRGRPHLGIDLAAPKGTSIYSAHEGLVIYVGREFRGYGRMVMVEGKDGFASLYAHLSKALVKAGSRVEKGQLIGEMGRTGRATGVHLHFEIRMKDGPVDPLNYLPGGQEIVRQVRNLKLPLMIWPDVMGSNDLALQPSWTLPVEQALNSAPATATDDTL